MPNLSSRLTPKMEFDIIIDENVVGDGNNKSKIDAESPAGSPINVMNSKVSRTARTINGDQPTYRDTSPAIGLENNQNHPISPTSSLPAHHMAKWVGQKPLKTIRTRRSNLDVPVSNVDEEASPQISTIGFSPSNLNAGTSYVKSKGKEHRREEMKLNEKGPDADEVSINANHKHRDFVLHPAKNKVLVNRRTRERVKDVPVRKPLQSSRCIPDKNRSKSGNQPSKNRMAPVSAGLMINSGSANSDGESDDDDHLFAAAKYARNARKLACSSPFWKKIEFYFASISSRDALYIKDQLNVAEELSRKLSQKVDDEYNVSSVLMSKENSCQKPVKTPSLYQRLLSALIDDEENGDLPSEVRDMSFQSASDDSHRGACEPKLKNKVESGANLQSHKHILAPNSCNMKAASNTNGSFSHNKQWQADDGLSNSSEIDGLSLDDRLLMELQSIGLSPAITPQLEKGAELAQDINELQALRLQQVQKMKKHLGKIDKAITDSRDAAGRNMEELAMDKLLKIAYKRQIACRSSESSNAACNVFNEVGLAFAKRTLDRYRKFEETGTSCFAEPAVQAFLFSAPSSKSSNPFKSTSFVPSASACNMHNKRKEILRDDVVSDGKNRNINNKRSKKALREEEAKGNGARTSTNPTGSFLRRSGQKAKPKEEAKGNGARTSTNPTGSFPRRSGQTMTCTLNREGELAGSENRSESDLGQPHGNDSGN